MSSRSTGSDTAPSAREIFFPRAFDPWASSPLFSGPEGGDLSFKAGPLPSRNSTFFWAPRTFGKSLREVSSRINWSRGSGAGCFGRLPGLHFSFRVRSSPTPKLSLLPESLSPSLRASLPRERGISGEPFWRKEGHELQRGRHRAVLG